jgi:hypothetical protein
VDSSIAATATGPRGELPLRAHWGAALWVTGETMTLNKLAIVTALFASVSQARTEDCDIFDRVPYSVRDKILLDSQRYTDIDEQERFIRMSIRAAQIEISIQNAKRRKEESQVPKN